MIQYTNTINIIGMDLKSNKAFVILKRIIELFGVTIMHANIIVYYNGPLLRWNVTKQV